MNGRKLPILEFARFRLYPTKHDQQTFSDERQVCANCLAGACCSSEHPIALRSFDVLRLAAFFSMTPASFLLSFTQERFRDEESDQMRGRFINDLNCSIVTYLRRRENSPTSPCIFLKYVSDHAGTPRRICSVHEARPLACREFYFDTCKKRLTGELAALLAEGYEKVRDGEITEALADAHLSGCGDGDLQSKTLAQELEQSFWVEMKRAANVGRANNEGANSYDMAGYQDPIEQKMNRLLSKKHRRLEKRLGPKLRDELMAYASGPSFAGSDEYQRIMTILHTRPSNGLFASGNYKPYTGVRTLFPGVKPSEIFATIPDEEISLFIKALPRVRLFPDHDMFEVRAITLGEVYGAVLRGYNHLIRFAGYLAAMGDVIEEARPGEFECQMLAMIAGFQTSLNPFIAKNPYFRPLKHWLAERTLKMMEADLAAADSPAELFDILRSLSGVQSAVPTLARRLRARFNALSTAIHARLQKNRLDLCVRLDNPMIARLAAGKRLNSKRAWVTWGDQLLDMRCAAIAGFHGVDLTGVYEQSVSDLEKIHFRKCYGLDLYKIVHLLARGMSFDNTVAYQKMIYKTAADRLAAYAVRLFNWMEETSYKNHDCEIIAGFSSAIYRGLGHSYNRDPSFGLITYRILKAQSADGSWKANPVLEDAPGTQTDYLYMMCGATRACVDALRPMRTDVIDTDNASLGLV